MNTAMWPAHCIPLLIHLYNPLKERWRKGWEKSWGVLLSIHRAEGCLHMNSLCHPLPFSLFMSMFMLLPHCFQPCMFMDTAPHLASILQVSVEAIISLNCSSLILLRA